MAGVKIIRKKGTAGGLKALIAKLEKLGQYTISCGIHSEDGGKRVLSYSKKQRVKREKSLVKISVEKEKIDKVTSTRKQNKRLNIATLASILEKFASWTQEKTAKVPAMGEGFVTFQAGQRYKRPGRIFISLFEDSRIWQEIYKFIENQFTWYITSSTRVSPFQIMKKISNFVSNRQRQRITRKETKSNAPATIKIKGEDYPLHKTGQLLNSIKGKVTKEGSKKMSKIKG